MAIALPSYPGPASATPRFVRWGSNLIPSLGGPVQNLTRLGDRHALDVTMPPLSYRDAMAWVQRLKRGLSEGVIFEFPQPGFNTGAPGSPLVNGAHAGGTTLSIKGLSSGYSLAEGQFLSIIHVGRRYLYSANAAGSASVVITPMLRTPLSNNDLIEIQTPMIEGYLEGDEQGWTIDAAHHVGLSFTIVERE